MENGSRRDTGLNEENAGIEGVQNVSAFRRILPQVNSLMSNHVQIVELICVLFSF